MQNGLISPPDRCWLPPEVVDHPAGRSCQPPSDDRSEQIDRDLIAFELQM
jgi:hypothetical protein